MVADQDARRMALALLNGTPSDMNGAYIMLLLTLPLWGIAKVSWPSLRWISR